MKRWSVVFALACYMLAGWVLSLQFSVGESAVILVTIALISIGLDLWDSAED